MSNFVTPRNFAVCILLCCNTTHSEALKPLVTDASQACSRDLAYLPEFLMRNDTGAANNRQHRGESAMATALEQANREAASAENDAQCVQALDRYLSSWRKGHLWVE